MKYADELKEWADLMHKVGKDNSSITLQSKALLQISLLILQTLLEHNNEKIDLLKRIEELQTRIVEAV